MGLFLKTTMLPSSYTKYGHLMLKETLEKNMSVTVTMVPPLLKRCLIALNTQLTQLN